ncbi:DUF4111 domain-containing protein [Paenibacillus filicis]|uniref:DUF4111 domain-containing protein n=1 Tax=Paenibacillus gyeongsangnamensis TaxID=3388067 RepID=A0ABT4Q4U1_9BACL|nr:nucleotidyltransferase domain-containing protein [Paenibacillus filicis]MCZ8511878.1 DUF4111 domain-containing protein [Paenibacillus filicis]
MLPDKVEQTMSRLCAGLQSVLPDNLDSVYVYGSVALGAYIEGSSDIDFIAVLRRRITDSEYRAIAAAHHELEQTMPGTDIMGAYIRREDLGKPAHTMRPFPTYFSNRLHLDGTGADLNPVTWWILRRHGICVYGSNTPMTYSATAEELTEYTLYNMNTYWAGWIGRLEQQLVNSEHNPAPEAVNEAVEWCVLGMLRQWYTLREHDVTSKIGAGEYGLERLPGRWHGLISEAIAIKRREPVRQDSAGPERLRELVELLRYLHQESNGEYHH